MAHQPLQSTWTLLERILLVGTLVALSFVDGRASAQGRGPQAPIPPEPYPWGYGYGAEQPDSKGSGSRGDTGSGGGGAAGSPANDDGRQKVRPGSGPICGSWRFGIQHCELPIKPPPGPADGAPRVPTVSPVQLAQQAWRRLPIPIPEVATAPPRGSDGLVGLSEWFWVTNWDSQHSRVQVGEVWAEVTARPTSLAISPGAGQSLVTCNGPGTAYDRRRPADGQRSDCSHTYGRSSAGLPSSAYQVTATVTWGGTWVGTGGAGGALPALSRSTRFPLRIAEGQAVTGG
jgi:hypothetical protein